MHMPSHKGEGFLGCECLDITEINGADALYSASGIIKESEENASVCFGCKTLYSTEGSSHCIRAMLYLLKLHGVTRFIAGRNAHKAFISACALLDISPIWLYGEGESYLSCNINLEHLKALISQSEEKTALFITSPDYLGNIADLTEISQICLKNNVLLCVDNAHGAYLNFLKNSLHPIALGASLCCDSAHKTLPVLTGGAYLHISPNAPRIFTERAKDALALFGSTSPSYLILQSLDKANLYLSDYKERLADFLTEVEEIKKHLTAVGYTLIGDEPLKITVSAKEYGYYGYELAEVLEKLGIFCEFADRDFLVLMLSIENKKEGLSRLLDAMSAIEKRQKISEAPPAPHPARAKMTIREAVFADREEVNATDALGRVLAEFNIACPPAVPIAVCGEEIDENALKCFEYYGITRLFVVK